MHDPAGDVPLLRRLFTQSMDESIECLGARGRQRHEGIHQARKAMRRARAALQLAAADLGPAAADCDLEIKLACRALSDARDAQARLETLERLTGDFQAQIPDEALVQVRRALTRQRTSAVRALLRADSGFRQLRSRLRAARDTGAALPWVDVRAETPSQALRTAHDRARRAQRKSRHHNSDAKRRHRWRRRLRHWANRQSLVHASPQTPGADAAAAATMRQTAKSKSAEKELLQLAHYLGFERDLKALSASLKQLDDLDLAAQRTLQRLIRKRVHAVRRKCPS